MWLAWWMSCRDPLLQEVDLVPLPTVPAAAPAGAAPVVWVTRDSVILDPTPWRDLLPDARPRRIVSLVDVQEHAYALPTLVSAVEPLRDAAAAADRAEVFAVAADRDVPYRVVVRVLHSLGMAQVPVVELRVTTPAGPGSVPLLQPAYCGAQPAAETGACVLPWITEVPAGLVVELDELARDRPGCVAGRARVEGGPPPSPVADDWRGAVAVTATGACPSVPGRDPVLLGALLDRTAALGTACRSAVFAAADATPWGEVVTLLTTLRGRHDAAMLALAVDADETCAPSWVLGP